MSGDKAADRHGGDRRRNAVTVRISVHLTSDGSTAVGIIRQEWQGATRLDYRIKGLERRPVPAAPAGVAHELWAALCTLDAMCKQQHARASKETTD